MHGRNSLDDTHWWYAFSTPASTCWGCRCRPQKHFLRSSSASSLSNERWRHLNREILFFEHLQQVHRPHPEIQKYPRVLTKCFQLYILGRFEGAANLSAPYAPGVVHGAFVLYICINDAFILFICINDITWVRTLFHDACALYRCINDTFILYIIINDTYMSQDAIPWRICTVHMYKWRIHIVYVYKWHIHESGLYFMTHSYHTYV